MEEAPAVHQWGSFLFVFLQFPIVDLRGFFGAERLAMPEWPPRTGVGLNRFVRSFGPAVSRARGADAAWTDETSYCRAAKALRFVQLDFDWKSHDWRKKRRCAFRRLLFDGQVVGRVETGLYHSVESEQRRYDFGEVENWDNFDLTRNVSAVRVLDNVIGLQTRTPLDEDQTSRELIKQGPYLARLFANATAPVSPTLDTLPSIPMVSPGSPMCLIECMPRDFERLPKSFVRIQTKHTRGIELAYGRVRRFGGDLGVWVVSFECEELARVRSLRLTLSRLHAEQEALFTVLSALETGQLIFKPRTESGDRLEAYLNLATRVVNGKYWMGIEQSAIQDAFRATIGTVRGPQLTNLADRLEGARRQVVLKVQSFMKVSSSAAVVNFYSEGTVVSSKVINIGDGNTIVGPVAIADTIENSFNTIENSQQPTEVKELVETLIKEVATAASGMPEDMAADMSQDVETLSKELARETPRRKWYELSIDGLKTAAEAVGEVGTPIVGTLKKLLPLLVSIFP